MHHENNKTYLESLESLSVSNNLKESKESQIMEPGFRKSSFDIVNILQNSDQFARRQIKNSLEFLNSNATIFERRHPITPILTSLNQRYELDLQKIRDQGLIPLKIGQAYSQEEEQDTPPSPSQPLDLKNQSLSNLLPSDIAHIMKLHDIPFQYVKGLVFMKDQKQIKSTRRLKVQRYLAKRRNKTWDRKICYNCRQKVAEERLRIKGKFIKKRRAMEILGIKGHIALSQLKKRLERELTGERAQQIQEIIKLQAP